MAEPARTVMVLLSKARPWAIRLTTGVVPVCVVGGVAVVVVTTVTCVVVGVVDVGVGVGVSVVVDRVGVTAGVVGGVGVANVVVAGVVGVVGVPAGVVATVVGAVTEGMVAGVVGVTGVNWVVGLAVAAAVVVGRVVRVVGVVDAGVCPQPARKTIMQAMRTDDIRRAIRILLVFIAIPFIRYLNKTHLRVYPGNRYKEVSCIPNILNIRNIYRDGTGPGWVPVSP
jgi:hypothetical protein